MIRNLDLKSETDERKCKKNENDYIPIPIQWSIYMFSHSFLLSVSFHSLLPLRSLLLHDFYYYFLKDTTSDKSLNYIQWICMYTYCTLHSECCGLIAYLLMLPPLMRSLQIELCLCNKCVCSVCIVVMYSMVAIHALETQNVKCVWFMCRIDHVKDRQAEYVHYVCVRALHFQGDRERWPNRVIFLKKNYSSENKQVTSSVILDYGL